jgi:hypothetical protein
MGPLSESEDSEELELEAGEEGVVFVSVGAGRGTGSSLRESGGWEGRNERGTSRRGEGGRKCLLCVTVFVEGVRESGVGAVVDSQMDVPTFDSWGAAYRQAVASPVYTYPHEEEDCP